MNLLQLLLYSWLVLTASYETADLLSYIQTEAKCMVTARGNGDGFGHQFEGKLSCLLLQLTGLNILYVHSPLESLQHTTLPVNEVEDFTAIGHYFPNTTAVQSFRSTHNLSTNYEVVSDLVKWFEDFEVNRIKTDKKGLVACSKSAIYVVDNCWDLAYKIPHAEQINQVSTINALRQIYFRSPKRPTGFDRRKINIVLHIRQTDAGRRKLNLVYYIQSLKYYLGYFHSKREYFSKRMVVWVETDAPDIISAITLSRELSADERKVVEFHDPLPDEPFYAPFHRMVEADAVVLSLSSFSVAAVLLNNSSHPMIAPSRQHGGNREEWFRTHRFHRISDAIPANAWWYKAHSSAADSKSDDSSTVKPTKETKRGSSTKAHSDHRRRDPKHLQPKPQGSSAVLRARDFSTNKHA